MNTEEKDEQQERPRKIIPSIRRDYENPEEGNRYERRPYSNSGTSRSRYSSDERNEYSSLPRRTPRPRISTNRDRDMHDRPSYGNNYEQGGYERRDYGSTSRGQNPYDRERYTQPFDSQQGDGEDKPTVRRKRPRVGESARINPYDSNRDQRSPGNYQTPYRDRRDSGYRDAGHRDSGYRDSGYRDSGYRDSGYRDTRQRDTGYRDSNYRDSGYRDSGYRDSRQRSSGYRDSGYNQRQQDGGYTRRQPYYDRPAAPRKRFDFPKPVKYKEVVTDPNEPIRLNKFLANAGVSSRREADELIKIGAIKVNDQVITELGTKITRLDNVTYNDKPVQIESKIYLLLNKPKNVVTTSEDPQDRRTVMDLVKNACSERIYPVGRLDRNTTGVLLLTNDGDLASKLTHPSFKKKKIYHVWLDKAVSIDDMERLATGIELEDGEVHADAISYVTEEDKSQIGIEIHSGRNRIVRRMFESLGYHVIKLDRVYFAGLTKKNLPRGKWRYLSEMEVNALRMGSFE